MATNHDAGSFVPVSQNTSTPKFASVQADQSQYSLQHVPSGYSAGHQYEPMTRDHPHQRWGKQDFQERWRGDRSMRGFIYLTFISVAMFIINLVEVTRFGDIASSKHPFWWIIGVPLAILIVSIVLLLLWVLVWCLKNIEIARHRWSNIRNRDLAARIGTVLGLLLPIIFCQFWYLPCVALPEYRQIEWTSSYYEHPDGLSTPLVGFYIGYDDFVGDPGLSIDLSYLKGRGLANGTDISQFASCDPLPIAVDLGDNTEAIHYRGSACKVPEDRTKISSIDVIFFLANITVNDTTKLQDGYGGNLTLNYMLMDPKFSSDIDTFMATNSSGNEYDYAWESVDVVTASFEQITIDDVTKGQKYLTYNVVNEPGGRSFHENPCQANGTCSVGLMVYPSSILATTKQSARKSDLKSRILDEGSLLGGVAFFIWYFSIFTTG